MTASAGSQPVSLARCHAGHGGATGDAVWSASTSRSES
jgi:hypothetical protein